MGGGLRKSLEAFLTPNTKQLLLPKKLLCFFPPNIKNYEPVSFSAVGLAYNLSLFCSKHLRVRTNREKSKCLLQDLWMGRDVRIARNFDMSLPKQNFS